MSKSKLHEARNKINAFITEKMISSRHIECENHVGRFISKYYVSGDLEVSQSDRGLFISGPKTDVDIRELEKCDLFDAVCERVKLKIHASFRNFFQLR